MAMARGILVLSPPLIIALGVVLKEPTLALLYFSPRPVTVSVPTSPDTVGTAAALFVESYVFVFAVAVMVKGAGVTSRPPASVPVLPLKPLPAEYFAVTVWMPPL